MWQKTQGLVSTYPRLGVGDHCNCPEKTGLMGSPLGKVVAIGPGRHVEISPAHLIFDH